MQNQKLKLILTVFFVTSIVASSCSKQQYRARSKHYPHEKPNKY